MTTIKINRQILLDSLGIVEAAVPKKTPREILKNVLIKRQNDAAILRATDLEVGVRYSIPIAGSTGFEFATLIPAGRLRSILSEVTGTEITLTITGDKLEVEANRAKFTLPTNPVEEFPEFVVGQYDASVTLKGAALSSAIRRTIWATDPDSTRYAMSGIKLAPFADNAEFVATDSRRLVVDSVACSTDGEIAGFTGSIIIPAKAAAIVERLTSARPDADVKIQLSNSSALFHVGDQSVSTRLVEGRFPRHEDVVPDKNRSRYRLSIPAGPWLAAIRQSQITTNQESRGVDFEFTVGKLTLSSSASDVGSSRIELPFDNSGCEMTITIDPRFVADFLKTIPAESIVETFVNDSESAVLLTSDAGNFQYVVMPLSRDR